MSSPISRRTSRGCGLAAVAFCLAALTACGNAAASSTTPAAPPPNSMSGPTSGMSMSPGPSMGTQERGMKSMIMINDFTFQPHLG